MNTDTLTETNIERLPPQSIESEQAVLGSLLVSGDGITRILDLLEPEYFYRKAHQEIYAAMVALFDNNEPIDILTISQYLQDDGKLDSVGGRQYVTDLSLSVATTANLEYYAKIVQEKALLRNLIKAGTEIVGNCYEQVDADSALDKAEHMIFNLAQKRGMQQLVHIKHVVEQSFQRIEERYENRDTLSGIPSGFYDLDALTSGFQPSDLIIVAARPSMGKCLSFDSEIVLSDGSLSNIESIYKSRSGTLLTLKDNFKLSQTQPSAYIDDGLKPVYKVTTRLGRSVETTLSHPFLTFTGWKKLNEISAGTKIAVPRIIPVFGTKVMRECEIKLLAYFIGDGCLSNNKASFTNTNPIIQKDFLEAVEDFGGVNTRIDSGNRTTSFNVRSNAEFIRSNRIEFGNRLRLAIRSKYNTAIQFANVSGLSEASIYWWQNGKCVPSAERFEKICTALQIEANELIPFPITTISRSSKNPVVLWLDKLELWGKTAHDKKIPAEIFKLEKAQLALFINRLFATDGWATVLASGQAQLGYATVSKKLATQLQHLLLRFGIIAKLRLRKVKYKLGHRECFQLDITDGDSIKTFIDQIGIYGKELAVAKAKRAVFQKRKQTNCDLIPIQVWEQLTEKKGNESWASLARCSNFLDDSNIHVNRRALSRNRLSSLARSLNDSHLNNLATSDIYWDEIVSIEAMGIKQVYDLTIPETHNFIANDICVHNTALCLGLAQYAAIEKKIPVAIFSLEMSKEQLVQRMLCSEASIDANRLRTGHLHTNDWTHLAMAMGKLGEAPIYIDDSALLNVLEIRAKARRLKAENKGLGLIVVDYIQLLQGRKQTDNRVQEVSEISRSLKTLAREINVPVIALSQLSRAVEARQNKRPMLSDLRESGCLTGETLVYLPDAGVYQPINTLVGQTGFRVLALNTENWQLEPKKVTNAFSTGTKTVYKLTTTLGRSIRATANHKFLTLQGWQRLDELKPGMRIAAPRDIGCSAKSSMTLDELALLGYLIGDGCTLARHIMQFTTADYDIAQDAERLAKAVFGSTIIPRIVKERDWYQVYLPSSQRLTHGKRNPIAVWLDSLNIFNLRSYEKFIPQKVFMQEASYVAWFLKHLWSTDGTVSLPENSKIPVAMYATSSPCLAFDVQSLLLKLGIVSKHSVVPQIGKGRDQHHIVITGKEDLQKFLTIVGVAGQRKDQIAKRVLLYLSTIVSNTNRDIIPIEAWRLIVDPARLVSGLTTRQLQKSMGMSYCGSALYKSGIGRERALKIAKIVNSDELSNLATSDVYWDEIKTLELDGEEEVFDLTVEDLHNFVANNITVHNSIEQDADLVMFIYRDEYYNPESERRGEAEIIIAKQRNGPTGHVELLFQASITRFLNKVHTQYTA